MLYDITKFTQLDYPDKLACILWFAGCNYRCKYCYNPDIVFGATNISENEIFAFLKTRINKLDAVVLSGGEPTLYRNLIDLCFKIKKLGFKVKLDTNGSNYKKVSDLIEKNRLDMIALDYKAPKIKFAKVAGIDIWDEFSETLNLLNYSNIKFEVRTTVHSDILNEDDIYKIIDDLYSRKYQGVYSLQNFLKNTRTLGNISNQKQILDTALIANYAEDKIKMEFRNF